MRCGDWDTDSSSTCRGSGIYGDMASFEAPDRVLRADQSPRGCTDATFRTGQPLWSELNTSPREFTGEIRTSCSVDYIRSPVLFTDDVQACTRYHRPSGRLLSSSAFEVLDCSIHRRFDAPGHVERFIGGWGREGSDTGCQRPP